MLKQYEPPRPGESEHDWLARNLYWANRECAAAHVAPCDACVARVACLRSGDLSREPGSARKFLEGLWAELAEKGRRGREIDGAFPRGKQSKASVYVLTGRGDEVLYVGKAKSVRARIWGRPNGHAATKPWFHEVEAVVVYDYETEGNAFDAEARWIYDLNPKYNKAIPTVPIQVPKHVDFWVFESPEEVRA